MSQCNNLKCYFAILSFETICIPLNTNIVKYLCVGFRARCKTIPECLWLGQIPEAMVVVGMVPTLTAVQMKSRESQWICLASVPTASHPAPSASCIAVLMDWVWNCISGKLVCKKCINPNRQCFSDSILAVHSPCLSPACICLQQIHPQLLFLHYPRGQGHLTWIDLTCLGDFLSPKNCLVSSWNRYVKLSLLLYHPEWICKDTAEEEKYKQIWCCCCVCHN